MLTKKTFDFLFENRLHDSKAWFDEHKDDYTKYVLEPLQELAVELAPVMQGIDGQFITEPKVGKTISRIRRDTRFTRDKSMYRDVMWLIFKRGKMYSTEYPGFYVEVSSAGYHYGCGYYSASPDFMQAMREQILKGSKSSKAALRAYESQDVFQLVGDLYKRAKYPDQPENLRDWLERKKFSFVAESDDFDLMLSPKFGEKLAGDYPLLKPVYDFLLETAQGLHETTVARPYLTGIDRL